LRVYRSTSNFPPGNFYLPLTRIENPIQYNNITPSNLSHAISSPSPVKTNPVTIGLSPCLTYNKDRILGTGANGTIVYEGTYQEGSGDLIYTQTCAVKRMFRSRDSFVHCKEVFFYFFIYFFLFSWTNKIK